MAFLSSEAHSAGLTREDTHFISKLALNSSHDAARKSIKQSIKACGLDTLICSSCISSYGGKTRKARELACR